MQRILLLDCDPESMSRPGENFNARAAAKKGRGKRGPSLREEKPEGMPKSRHRNVLRDEIEEIVNAALSLTSQRASG
jgi:hypothetical protein